jgi:uracil-DNA glycosylase
MTDEFTDGRGDPWEFDSGPPKNRRWARLFVTTPNYRAIGVAISGDEEFRWHFGPMFYRGRLQDNSVRVLVIGQEGAQDESLSHRSFTGGTGARMQHVLNHLGVTRSYLFLNTFVYPIFGQYNGLLPKLAQDPRSPIARHRGELFDYVLERNDVRLVIAVGLAAKQSVANWIEAHGGSADPERLHEADSRRLGAQVKTIGVLHPGGASKGGATAKIIADFKRAIRQLEQWELDAPGWLPVDPGATRLPADAYTYSAAPIPFRDFPYGTNWRLGRGSTSSNRAVDQKSIQLFAKGGEYGDTSAIYMNLPASTTPDSSYVTAPGDLPYEPARTTYLDFDAGPTTTMARLLQGGSPGRPWPDFASLGLSANPSLGHGPGYRGRLARPSILVLADQESQDDLFTGRALTGNVGQHLQAFLRSAGVTKQYAILRTLPVDSLGDPVAAVTRSVDDPGTRSILREVMRLAQPGVIVTLGQHAERVATAEAPPGTPVVHLAVFDKAHPSEGWQPGLDALAAHAFPRDVSPGPCLGGREPIPRGDLPFGTLRWQATTGDRAQRGRIGGTNTPNYYKLRMPSWAANSSPTALTAAEAAAVAALKAHP